MAEDVSSQKLGDCLPETRPLPANECPELTTIASIIPRLRRRRSHWEPQFRLVPLPTVPRVLWTVNAAVLTILHIGNGTVGEDVVVVPLLPLLAASAALVALGSPREQTKDAVGPSLWKCCHRRRAVHMLVPADGSDLPTKGNENQRRGVGHNVRHIPFMGTPLAIRPNADLDLFWIGNRSIQRL